MSTTPTADLVALAEWCKDQRVKLEPSIAWESRNPEAKKIVCELVTRLTRMGPDFAELVRTIRIHRHRSQQAACSLLMKVEGILEDATRRPPGNAEKLKGTTKPPTAPKKRGRPVDTDIDADKRLGEAWATGQHKTFADLAKAKGIERRQAKLAVERYQKRIKRKPRRTNSRRKT